MTIDEAKRHVARLVKRSVRGDIDINGDETTALDIALWLMEREGYVRAIVNATNLHAEALATQAMIDWEAEHPRPGDA